MKLKEFKVTNISDLHVVVRTPSETFGLNPKDSQITIAEKMGDIVAPKDLIEITSGKKTFFKVNETVVEINHDGKILSGIELKISDVNESLNTKIKETVNKKTDDVVDGIKDLAKEVAKEVKSKVEETKTEEKVETKVEETKTPAKKPAPKKAPVKKQPLNKVEETKDEEVKTPAPRRGRKKASETK